MSLDFANEAYFTVVSCNCVCADGYSATNLNSSDKDKQSRGFQGERFVRTPVALHFQFYVPISIQKVEFAPFIGRQCARVVHLNVSKVHPLADKNDSSTELHRNTASDDFKKAGTVLLTKPTKVAFVNRAYRPHPRLPVTAQSINTVDSYTNGDLTAVTALRIVIQNMLEASVPSLTKLHIWGRPARSSPSNRTREIFQIYEKLKGDNSQGSGTGIQLYGPILAGCSDSSSQGVQNTSLPAKEHKMTETVCPTEFIDPLTLEIMRMPVLLPSGHNVDRTTLDKHIRSQSEMGNIPSDPFTGIPFTGSNKPEPNVKLKIRLDSYALQSSKLDNDVIYSRKRSHSPESRAHRIKLTPVSAVTITAEPTMVSPNSSNNHIISKLPKYMEKDLDNGEHSLELTSSLDSALANIRQSKRSRNFRANTSDHSTLYCAKCEAFVPGDSVRYQLPCSHIICFQCSRMITGKNKLTCSSCSDSYEFKSIKRVFH